MLDNEIISTKLKLPDMRHDIDPIKCYKWSTLYSKQCGNLIIADGIYKSIYIYAATVASSAFVRHKYYVYELSCFVCMYKCMQSVN